MITFKFLIPFLGLALCGLCLTCKTKDPPPEVTPLSMPVAPAVKGENPVARLVFERVEAEDVEQFTLYFVLEVENPRSAEVDLAIRDWHIQINNRKSNEGAALSIDSDHNRVAATGSARFPLRLDLDMNKFSPFDEEDAAEYQTALQVDLGFAFATGDTAGTLISAEAVFPRIREPEFIITSIAVSKGERTTNTHFRVSLQIDNPNVFPLELSSLTYSFYGDGHFWADGKKDIFLQIPANSSAETQVFLLINFIDISLNLQDKLIALKRVHYRLTGETTILTNIVYLPEFHMDFDLSRESDL